MSKVIIITFGYLHGEPPEGAHVVWDLRNHFRDPHAVSKALRHLTARDQEIRETVLDTPGIVPLIEAMAATTRAYMAGPAADDTDLVLAIGCAGGKHRSAVSGEELENVLVLDGYQVVLIHRDIDKPPVDRDAARPVLNSNPVELDAEAYAYLANVLRDTMADPDYWDGEEAESWILGQYIYWLAAGQPLLDDGFPDRSVIDR